MSNFIAQTNDVSMERKRIHRLKVILTGKGMTNIYNWLTS